MLLLAFHLLLAFYATLRVAFYELYDDVVLRWLVGEAMSGFYKRRGTPYKAQSKPEDSCLESSPPLPLSSVSVSAMEISCRVVLHAMVLCVVFSVASVNCSRFDELFEPSWASDHVIYEGELLKLKLDNFSGAGFASKNKYLFGKTSAEIKLVEGDSAGTVTAFYMSSDGPNHHEFDFEFLGNTTGEPYLVQTNIYINGIGNREQRMDLWFDPTAEFHSYSILWNHRQVVFLVDETPIRVYENKEEKGVVFPKDQPMGVYSSIWNADDWATQGGRVKTDWTHAPFVTTFRGFQIDGCECSVEEDVSRCSAGVEEGKEGRWWEEPVMEELSVHQSHQLMWVRAKHLIYDYCWDTSRFSTVPAECVR